MTTQIPTRTESILNEDGADAALAIIADQVAGAENDIVALLAKDPDRTWTVRTLQDAAADGRSSSVMSIAFLRLLKAGQLRVDHASSIVEAA